MYAPKITSLTKCAVRKSRLTATAAAAGKKKYRPFGNRTDKAAAREKTVAACPDGKDTHS
jgi:hypothetical protein